MHKPLQAFADLETGALLGPFAVVVSPAANERYWRAAGVEHPALVAGALYPPIAANLTVLTFQQHCADPVVQTRQRLVSHRRQDAGIELVCTGRIGNRYEKRGRAYVDVHTTVATADRPGEALWESDVTFTPAATL